MDSCMALLNFWVKKKKKKINVDEDLEIISLFFNEVNEDIENLKHLFAHMKILRHKYGKLIKTNAPQNAIRANVQEQIQTYDKILQLYRFLDEDVEINGLRSKMVSDVLVKKAQELSVDPEILKLTKQPRWTFNW